MVFWSPIYVIGPCCKPEDGLLGSFQVYHFPLPSSVKIYPSGILFLLVRFRTAESLAGPLIPLGTEWQSRKWSCGSSPGAQVVSSIEVRPYFGCHLQVHVRKSMIISNTLTVVPQSSTKKTYRNLALTLTNMLLWEHRWWWICCGTFKECAQTRTGIWSIHNLIFQTAKSQLLCELKPPSSLLVSVLILPFHSNTLFCLLYIQSLFFSWI